MSVDTLSAPAASATAETAGPQERLALAKEASRAIGQLTSDDKARALEAIAQAIEAGADRIISANAEDVARGEADGIGAALIDRLRLDEKR
ncbi:MAG TPA: gamma-glutamyl-phosphate reductase, partial [Microbacterium sp.]|nr:gamma-glutamyl-phosphate reductase [Microbacterium sp.]